VNLVWPSPEYLPGFVAALEQGWSPDNVLGRAAAEDALREIARNSARYLASLVDKEAAGDPIPLPDGSFVPRLPGYQRWVWDGEFCGAVRLRWQRGTEELPLYCLGHVGYTIVAWKRSKGYATEAVRQILPEAKAVGLRYVEITTDPDNLASRRVIEANGGVFVEEFTKPRQLGGGVGLRFRISL
jgi:predicted acetyltransferase